MEGREGRREEESNGIEEEEEEEGEREGELYAYLPLSYTQTQAHTHTSALPYRVALNLTALSNTPLTSSIVCLRERDVSEFA